jgi:hypothetical protein
LKSCICVCIAAAGLVVATQASAEIYKCSDAASASSFYSQLPCPDGTTAKRVSPQTAPEKAPDSNKPPAPVNPELEFRKRQKERAAAETKAAEEAAAAKRRQEDCQQARELVATYAPGQRIVRMNENGERDYLDEAQLERERTRAQALVEQLCK